MKKALCILNAAFMMLSFSACKNNKEEVTVTASIDDETSARDESFDVFNEEETSEFSVAEKKTTEKKLEKDKKKKDKEKTKEKSTYKKSQKETSSKKETKISTEKTEKEKPKDSKPSTKAEIIEYYNKANTKVRQSAKSITHTYKNITLYKNIVETGNLSGVAKLLIRTFVKEEKEHPTYTNRNDIINMFPAGRVKTSNITEASVKEAKCIDKGDYYEIYLSANCSDSNPDVNPKDGGGVAGRFFTVLMPSEVTDAAGNAVSLQGVKFSYVGGYVQANIDKKTGNITKLSLNMPVILSIDSAKAGILKVNNAKIGLDFNESWSVAW